MTKQIITTILCSCQAPNCALPWTSPLISGLTEVVIGAGEAPAAEEEEAAEPVMVDWPYGALDTVEASTFYLDVARAGIQYGPHFKMVHKRHIEGKQVVLRWE